MTRLFGTAGIRGPYGKSVTPRLAMRLGLALARFLGGGGRAVVGHDMRTTSPLLASSVASGLMAGGVDVEILGLVPTPVLAYGVRLRDAGAGVMVTASHNPPEDNGLKVFTSGGMETTEDEEEGLERLMGEVDPAGEGIGVSWDQVGRLAYGAGDVPGRYLGDLYAVLEPRDRGSRVDVRVMVDCGNGVSGPYTPVLLRGMGLGVFTTNCQADGHFPGRYPEPRKDVVEPLMPLMRQVGASVLLAHDGDADRLAVVTPRRGFVKQDYIIALYALHKLRERRGTVIVSVDVGRSVERVVEEHGGRLVRAKLGKTHEKLREVPDALLAAEPWKLIDPRWGPWVDGIYQAGLLARIILEEGRGLDELLDEIPELPWARVDIKLDSNEPGDKERLYRSVAEELASSYGDRGEVLEIDGLRVDLGDGGWFLVRKSGTEAKLRLYLEAGDRRRLEELLDRILGVVREKAGELGIGVERPVVNRG